MGKTMEQSLPCIMHASEASIALMQNHIRLNRLVRAQSSQQRKALQGEIASTRLVVTEAFKQLAALVSNPEERGQLDELERKREEANQARSRIYSLAETDAAAAARALDEARPAFDAYLSAAEAIVKHNRDQAAAQGQQLVGEENAVDK